MIQCGPFDMATIDDFKKLDLRVADVVKVEHHPNADRLWLLTIRIGEEERQIVAGIKKYYTAEELTGKKVVVIANLEPAVIRGVESRGMLLAANGDDQVVVLTPEKAIPSGTAIR